MIFPRDENGKTLDLNQREWKSEPRHGEPFWGPGWPSALAYVAGLTIVFSFLYWLRH